VGKKPSRLLGLLLACALVVWSRPLVALDFAFFSNVDFSYGRGAASNTNFRNGSFGLGQAGFFLTHPFDDHFRFLGEFVLSASTAATFSISAERLQIGYTLNDLWGVDAGRFHTPIGYWNTAYHHGAVMHLSVARPFFLNFDGLGGLVPIHAVGLMTGGHTHTEETGIEYRAYVANGVRIGGINTAAGTTTGTLDPRNLQDISKNKMFGIDLQVRRQDGLWEGGQLGVGGLYHRVQAQDSNSAVLAEIDQFLIALDLAYEHRPIQFVSEYFLYVDRIRFGGSGTSLGHAFYSRAGYTLYKHWTPYLGWEQLRVEGVDPYFTRLAASNRHLLLGGLHIQLPHQNVLKLEGRALNFTRGAGSRGGEGIVSWAFGF